MLAFVSTKSSVLRKYFSALHIEITIENTGFTFIFPCLRKLIIDFRQLTSIPVEIHHFFTSCFGCFCKTFSYRII